MAAAARGATAGRLSLRAFARRVGVTHKAVQKGIASGRLRESVGRDARGPFVRDAALAEREWVAGATQLHDGGNGAGSRKVQAHRTLVEAQLRVATERGTALELANRKRRGELHEVAACARQQFEIARSVRERILNVPDRLGDVDQALRARIRAELRQALGSLADELEHA